MLDLRLAIFSSAAVTLALAAGAVEPRRPGQDAFLTKAVFAEGRLWMRSDAGIVFSVAEGELQRREESLPGAVLDLCTKNGKLVVLTSEADAWTLRSREGADWIAETSIDAERRFGTLHCTAHDVTVVTQNRVFLIRDDRTRAVVLSRPLPGALVSSLYIEGDRLFVGLNRGEFGGGLVRVDLRTGLVTAVERRTNGLCGGPLNSACDPVHGIAAEPWKPGCVVAAIGLIHMRSHGRLVEICDNDVRTLVSRRYKTGTSEGREERNDIGTVAFFGLARSDGVLVAAGIDGVYRVSAQGFESKPLPPFKDVGGIKVSFDVPGVVLVLTDVNARHSLSGSVPLIVSRD
jgi:hypothetical protein